MSTNKDSERRPIKLLISQARTHQGINNPARQRSLMLHYAGTAVQDIHKSLTEAATDDTNTAFSRTVGALDT